MPTRLKKDEERALAQTIGQGMRAARKREALRQQDAAELIGLATEVYGRYERGQQLPSVPMLMAIIIGLKARPNELLGKGPAADNTPTRGALVRLAKRLPNTPSVRRVLRALGQMKGTRIHLVAQVAAHLSSTK